MDAAITRDVWERGIGGFDDGGATGEPVADEFSPLFGLNGRERVSEMALAEAVLEVAVATLGEVFIGIGAGRHGASIDEGEHGLGVPEDVLAASGEHRLMALGEGLADVFDDGDWQSEVEAERYPVPIPTFCAFIMASACGAARVD